MDNTYNVCLLNDSFPPLIDGVANVVVNYALLLKKYGCNTTVVTPAYPNVKDNYPFNVIRYPSIDFTKLTGYRAGYPFNSKILSKLTKQDYDIIHCHCPMSSAILARTIRENTTAPLICTYHTKFDIDIKKIIPQPSLQDAIIRFMVNNINSCDEVWTVSKGAGENLRSLGYTGNYTIVKNGVDFPQQRVDYEQINKINDIHLLNSNTPVFLFVGRMMWYKGIKTILDGVLSAKLHGLKFKMIFIGDGADIQDIQSYINKLNLNDTCILAGAIQDRQLLRAYFCRSTLFLFPSTFDTNGIVVREAAACGLASVLIKDSCAAEGITDRYDGFLINDDPYYIADSILFACENPDYVKNVGLNAQKSIYISWDEATQKVYDQYVEIRYRFDKGYYSCHKPAQLDTLIEMMADISNQITGLESIYNGVRIKGKTLTTKIKEKTGYIIKDSLKLKK